MVNAAVDDVTTLLVELTSKVQALSYKPASVEIYLFAHEGQFFTRFLHKRGSFVMACLFTVISLTQRWQISFPLRQQPKALNLSLSLCLIPVQEFWRIQLPQTIALSLSEAAGKIFIFNGLQLCLYIVHTHTCSHTHLYNPAQPSRIKHWWHLLTITNSCLFYVFFSSDVVKTVISHTQITACSAFHKMHYWSL